MRISLNWLKDYLDIKPGLDISDICESLTLAGLEVESVECLLERSQSIFLGKVLSKNSHGEKGALINVDWLGKIVEVHGQDFRISVGEIVAFKNQGSKKSEYGVADYADIGFKEGAGIPIVFNDASFETVPENLSLVKDFDDTIVTLGITPNRADALSHLGISRELSALLDCNPRLPMLTPKEMAGPTHEKVAIEIENAEDCPRYACRIIENVLIAESPYWLKLRLLACGIRPINNVVDVTNYVMLSRGQPMHAFDFSALERENGRAKIIVRRAQNKEKLRLLDGKDYELSPDDVVIADTSKVLALAGVMGGSSTAINPQTTTILLESAYFLPTNVRMTARAHGISTESSYRFERGADPNGVVDALNYAARIISEITEGKVCREAIDAYRKHIDTLELKMRPDRAQAVLGMNNESFDQDLIRKRFLRLGIETVAKRGDAIYFRVPTYRSDLTREIDLIEEAARMIGYDKVSDSCLGLDVEADFEDKKSEAVLKKIRHVLAGRGFHEAINYAFLPKDYQNLFLNVEDQATVIELKNPLSERYGVLRKSSIPGLVKNVLHNQNNQERSIQLFEIATVFLGKRAEGLSPTPEKLKSSLDQDSFCKEQQVLAGVMAGRESYSAYDHKSRNFDFYHLKGVLTELFTAFGKSDRFPKKTINFDHGSKLSYLHPGESATIVHRLHGEERILGNCGKLHPELVSLLSLSTDVFVFELFIKDIVDIVAQTPQFQPFSRYPLIERDVAFLVDEHVLVGDMLSAVEALSDADNILNHIEVFDIYRGKNIGADKKSVAISLCLQREDRTLTDEEAHDFINRYVAAVQEKTGAQVR